MKKHCMVLFLHFEGVPESHFQTLIGVLEIQLVYLGMSRVPLLNFEEGPGSLYPEFPRPGSWSHFYTMPPTK